MFQDVGNLWSYVPDGYESVDARVITTSGSLKSNGEAVMGKGCALEAARHFPLLPRLLGKKIKKQGNHVHVFHKDSIQGLDYDLITFPTKHTWHENSDLDLIFRSACELADVADSREYGSVVLPRPGTGAGNLEWEQVRSTIRGIFDDRFYIVSFEP